MEVGGWEEVGWVGGWAVGNRLQLITGLFGGSVNPRSASHRPKQA